MLKKKISFNLKIDPESLWGFGATFLCSMSAINHALEKDISLHINILNHTYTSTKNNWDIVFEQPFGITDSEANSLEKCTNWDLGESVYSYHADTRNKFQDNEFISNQRKVFKKYVKPKEEIQKIVNEFLDPYKSKKILGIHKRGRDHFTSGHAIGEGSKISLDYVKNIIDEYIDNYDYLYVTSDESKVYQFLSESYPEKFLFYDDKTEWGNNEIGLHALNSSEKQKIQMIKDICIEVLILSKCDKMLLMNSNISHMALFFSNTNNFKFYDNHVRYQ